MPTQLIQRCAALLAVAVLALPSSLRAQTATITGRVLDAETRAPIQAVTVEWGDRYTFTDAEGHFTLTDVRPGGDVLFRRLGYRPTTLPSGSVTSVILLEPLPVLMEALYVEPERGELLATGTALAVSRVDRETIRSSAGTGVAETLDASQGVSVSYMGAWGSRPVLRGLGGERVAVLIDGNRVSRACTFGMDQGLATIDPSTVERVEILSGPGSALYGSGNLGGVINVVTRRPEAFEGTSGEVRMGGSSGIPGGTLGASLATTLRSVTVSASLDGASYDDYRTSEGPVDGSSYRQVTADLRTDWVPGAAHRVSVKGQYYAGRDIGWPMRGGAEIPEETRTALSADWGWQKGGGLLDGMSARGYFQKLDHHMVMSMVMPGMNGMTMTSLTDAVSFSETSGLRAQARLLPLPGLHVEVGSEATHLLAEGTRWTERQMGSMDPTELAFRSWPGVRVVDVGGFGQAEMKFGSRVAVSGGIRLDRVYRKADEGESVEEWIATGNAGLRLGLARGLSLRASLGSGYRTPDPLELYGLALRPDGFIYRGNASLETERSLNTEVALGLTRGEWSTSVTLFHNRLTDLVVPGLTTDSVAGRPVREYQNLGESRLRGFSGGLSGPLGGGFSTRANLTYTRGKDLQSGAALPMIPPLEGGIAIRRGFGRSVRWVEIEWTGAADQERISESAGEVATPGWAVTNLRSELDLAGTTVTLGVENLFDELYRAHLDPLTIRRPGRNLFVRLSRSF